MNGALMSGKQRAGARRRSEAQKRAAVYISRSAAGPVKAAPSSLAAIHAGSYRSRGKPRAARILTRQASLSRIIDEASISPGTTN